MHSIGAHSASPAPPANRLSDGDASCAYSDLPAAYGAIDKMLDEAGVTTEDWLAVDCLNTLAGAILVLYLLARGRSAVLLPPSAQAAGGDRASPDPPGFCAFRLTPGEIRDGFAADAFLLNANHKFLRRPVAIGEPALCIFTSGSTAAPKMAAHGVSRLIGNARNCTMRFALDANDQVTIPVPIFHMYGLGAAFLPAVLAGASIDLQPGANVLTYAMHEARFQPNVAFLTPALCESVLLTRKANRPLRLTVTAGDRLDPVVHANYERRFGPTVSLYGSTELGAIAAGAPDDPEKRRRGTVGKPMPGVRLCADGEAGVAQKAFALAFRHPHGCLGYLEADGKLATDAVASGCFHTQDLGRVDEDGYLEVLGRLDHQVKRDGMLVAFADVETALRSLPEIRQVCVISSGRGRRGALLVACCQLTENARTDQRSVRRASLERLPAYAVPDRVVLLSRLPTLASGKVDRHALKRQYEQTCAADHGCNNPPDGNG